MNNCEYKGVLFDLDGTLADNCFAIREGIVMCFEKFGINKEVPDVSVVRKTIGASIVATLGKFLPDCKKDMARELGAYYMKIFPQIIFDGLKVLDGAKEVLDDLRSRGYKLACFSNKQQEAVAAIMEKLGLAEYLDSSIGTKLDSFRKPDAAYTNYALSKVGIMASETLMVGDSPYDYQASVNAAMRCALVTTGSHTSVQLREACPDAVGIFPGLKEMRDSVFGRK